MTDKQMRNIKPLYKMFSNKNHNYMAIENDNIFLTRANYYNDVFDGCISLDYQQFEKKYLLKKFANNQEYCQVINSKTFLQGALESLSNHINKTPDIMMKELDYIIGKRERKVRRPFNENKVQKEIKQLYNSYIAEIERIRKSYFIACFTENVPDKNISMWYFYANQYKGFCAEYSFERLIWDIGSSRVLCDDLDYRICQHIRKVVYYDYFESIDIDYLLSIKPEQVYTDKKVNSFVFRAIYYKNKSWKTENEWRLIIKKEDPFLQDVLVLEKENGVIIQFPFLKRLCCVKSKGDKAFFDMAKKRNIPISIFTSNNGQLNFIDVGEKHEINLAVQLSRICGKEVRVDFFNDKKVKDNNEI